MHWHIRVPASTSNLGPGFDCLGLALDLALEVRVARDARSPGVRYRGTQPPSDNLFARALASAGGLPHDTGAEVASAIPLGRGLGSSAAAIVAGILTARLAAGDCAPDRDAVLDAALAFEGHPDNLAAVVYGGLVASALDGDHIQVMPLALAPCWSFVLVIPDRSVETHRARALLPQTVPLADAVHNLQHLAYLLGALARGDAAQVRFGLDDRLHETRRLQLVPGLAEARAALAAEPGCAGAALSGSGPTLLGWVADPAVLRPTGAAAVAVLARHGVGATVVHSRPAPGAAWQPDASST